MEEATGDVKTPKRSRCEKLSRSTSSPLDWGNGTPGKYLENGVERPSGLSLTPRNVSYVDLTWDEEARRSKSAKRPREDDYSPKVEAMVVLTPGTSMQEKLCSLIKKLNKGIKSLKKVMDNNRNTKIEIKEVTQQIASVMSQINTADMQGILQRSMEAEESQRKVFQHKSRTVEAGTQYRLEDTDAEAALREIKINAALETDPDDNEVREVIQYKWKEEFFTRCIKVKEEVPLEDDIIVIVDKDKEHRDEKMKKVIDKFPQIKEVLAEKALEEQKLTSRVSRKGKITDDGSITYDNERHIHIISEKASYDQETDIGGIRTLLQKIGSRTRNMGRTKVECVVENIQNEAYIRKMMELTYRKEGPDVRVYSRKTDRRKSKLGSEEDQQKMANATNKIRHGYGGGKAYRRNDICGNYTQHETGGRHG
ncbi:hypothetical protein Zmor_005991 [Zophobas morio]|uniref:Uncharacterized protein n=1 Tax=Zophobas morio TaxID=2755281 RepID=A0AA38IWC3_9CUCU|nr:hypothetical protein Zmor_005991 [Zophobas morio]